MRKERSALTLHGPEELSFQSLEADEHRSGFPIRFCHDVRGPVETDLTRLLLVFLESPGENYNGNAGVHLALFFEDLHFFEGLNPVFHGHFHIHADRVGFFGLSLVDGFLPVLGEHDFVPVAAFFEHRP